MLIKRIAVILLALAAASSAVVPNAKTLADSAHSEVKIPEGNQERVYCVGSVSKVYVTAAVMQLKDKGLVDLDSPVTDYIPEFKMADQRYKKITVRMLMNHTSGIMGSQFKNMMLYEDNDMSSYDELLSSLAAQRLKAEPGEYAAYCNDGFTLLQILVERVSGMNYTDYVVKNIAGRIGKENTGTPVNMFRNDDNAHVYLGNLEYDYDYCMTLGSGGIYATASDAAEFGSAFWNGDDRLLSSSSKEEMSKRWSDQAGEYMDGSGLGWDYVESLAYEKAGVKVLGKGGDIDNQHAHLMVAPDNDISVCVLSSGGSSMYNSLVCEALMDAALEEQGIKVDHEVSNDDIELADNMPEEYKQYEGYYSMYGMTGACVAKIRFADNKTMKVEMTGTDKTDRYTYRYTSDGGFVEVDDNGYIKTNRQTAFFEKKDGKVYVKGSQMMNIPEIGIYERKIYMGEMLEPNPVSDELKQAWKTYAGTPWVNFNSTWSSTLYDKPFAQLKVIVELPGYVLFDSGAGSRLLKIVNASDAVAFQTMPSSSNRDLIDIKVTADGILSLSCGVDYLPAAALPEFDPSIKEITLTDNKADWYLIGDDIANRSITVDRSGDTTICVYNKYSEVVYTTHVKDCKDTIDLPEGGLIMFVGKTGSSVKID